MGEVGTGTVWWVGMGEVGTGTVWWVGMGEVGGAGGVCAEWHGVEWRGVG